MKKLIILPLVAATLTGCQLTHVKTPEWEVSLRSHWFKRDVDKFDVQRNADGSYSVSLNGYKSDTSEQLPAFTREVWAGLGVLGRIAGAAVNPAVASVPLTAEPADPAAVAKIQREVAAQKAELARIKADVSVARAQAKSAAAAPAAATNAEDEECEDCEYTE